MEELSTITQLSHEFGTPEYVKGGGGNTSYKNESTLWVKPSGTTLSGLTEETFVQLDRSKIDRLYATETPSDSAAREELVKNMMTDAVCGGNGRPSVEAPLHNVLSTKYVVHTHALLVNGMTCAIRGEEVAKHLFPEALWVEYIDAGYTLCMELKGRIEQYEAEHGKTPGVILLKNHGIFISGDTPEEIRALYSSIMDPLRAEYDRLGINETLAISESATNPGTEERIRSLFGDDAQFINSSGSFTCVPGPITPDHLVYARAFPFDAELNEENVSAYRTTHGFAPKVVIAGERVYGLGTSDKNARLALEFAMDGGQVLQLSQAFGGVEYMSDPAREFIENWEVESYRQSVAS